MRANSPAAEPPPAPTYTTAEREPRTPGEHAVREAAAVAIDFDPALDCVAERLAGDGGTPAPQRYLHALPIACG